MRVRKPYLQDTLPIELCVLCNRPFCANHKGIRDGVCEIDHVTYYYKHPDAENIYRTYEDWRSNVEEWEGGEDGERRTRELGGDIGGSNLLPWCVNCSFKILNSVHAIWASLGEDYVVLLAPKGLLYTNADWGNASRVCSGTSEEWCCWF